MVRTFSAALAHRRDAAGPGRAGGPPENWHAPVLGI